MLHLYPDVRRAKGTWGRHRLCWRRRMGGIRESLTNRFTPMSVIWLVHSSFVVFDEVLLGQ